MRTKTAKESKKVPASDLKIDLSVPKVVLDASDCAKFLDGTGKTSVILVERGGKIVPASSSNTSLSSSCVPLSSSFSSSRSSSVKSLSSGSTSVSSVVTSQSSKVCHGLPAHTGTKSKETDVDSKASNQSQTVMADKSEILPNHVPEPVLADQGKVILKPPKKRRGNDKGAYEDSSSLANPLLNGEAARGSEPIKSNDLSGVEAKEAVALRSTPSFPLISSSSSSLQKHTIENLLQVSPSSSANNNNSSSSNMNLISGRYSHPNYHTIPHPLHSTPIHDMCSQTTIPHPALPTATSSSSVPTLSTPALPQQPVAPPLPPPSSSSSIPLSSSAHNDVGSSVLHKNSLETMSHTDLNSSHVYSYSNQVPPSQTHSEITPVLTSTSDTTEKARILPALSPPAASVLSVASVSKPQSLVGSQPHFHTPIEQDEPINLSTCPKPEENIDLAPVIASSKECEENSSQNSTVPESEKSSSVEALRPDEGKVSNIVPSDVWKQNSDLAYAETNGIPHLHDERNESDSVRKNCLANETKVAFLKSSEPESNGHGNSKWSGLNGGAQSPGKYLKEEEDMCETMPLVSGHDESNPQEVKSLSAEAADYQASDQEQAAHQISEKAEACSNPSVSQITTPEEGNTKAKSKKASKKRADIPMDEESCALRSSIYSESIDDVIHHFEYVSEPIDDSCLTEEEEAILRQQFDESDRNCPDKRTNDKEFSGQDSTLEQVASNTHKVVDKKSSKLNHPETSQKGVAKSHLKGELKRQPKEKLSPSMQNVINILAIVAADSTNDESPSETGLAELEATLRSLTSKYQKKVLQLSEDSIISNDKTDAKGVSLLAKAKTILNGIAAFYPGENDGRVLDKGLASEDKPVDMESVESNAVCNVDKSTDGEMKNKSKKLKKRKSDSDDSKRPEEEKSSSAVSEEGASKPKKVKKTGGCKKKISSKPMLGSRQVLNKEEDPSPVTGQPSGESSFLSSSKIDTSDIGESIASTSGGSEQVTPVHEPDTKEEGVNTNHMDLESHDTGLESGTEDKDNKPVRHYKKRLDFVKCPQCDHQSRGRSALSRHMKKVHLLEADMPYKCHLCTYGCTKMASLNRHLFTHSVFPCSRCDFKTDERDKLTEHIAELHKDKLDMKLCKICNRYIKCEDFTIEEHTEKCKGPVPYKCTECSKEFKYASSLRVHYHTHFPDEPKRFKCELCDYRTNYKANLHKHHKNMHASKDRDVQCPDCGKMFSTDDNMRRHRKVHTLVQAFSCETCKKTFKTSGGLKGHQLIHTATRPFTCNIPGCNRTFRTQKFLKSHQEEFHRLVPKKFFCQVEGCNYSFFKRSHLKRHAITHTGERNYHCTYPGCSKSFRHADNLKVHFRGHTNEKPIQCHLCDFKCKQKNSLFWHKKKVHQIVEASGLGVGTAKTNEDDLKTKDGETHYATRVDTEIEGCKNSESVKPSVNSEEEKAGASSNTENSPSAQDLITECSVSLNKSLGGSSMDLYEFKSDGESEEEGPSPLRWETVKSASTAPLPPAPKELFLKIEREEKKERDKVEKAERKEQLKKEKADKKEQEKKEKAEKKELEKKERLEKKEQEKKEREEKKEQEKKEKLEQKEKDKKEKDELKEKEKKEREEQKEKERKEKEEQKEKEKKEKEEQKEKMKIEKLELQEKLKKEKEGQKEKERKEKERRKLEVKRLKEDAKKVLQKRSARSARGITKKTLGGASLKSTAVKAKKSFINLRRKSPARGRAAAAHKLVEEKKTGRGRKKTQASPKEETSPKDKPVEGRKKRVQSGKSPSNDKQEKLPSRSNSPRAASPRGGSNKAISVPDSSRKASDKGKKKATVVPKRKPSARIKAHQKSQEKEKKKKAPAVVVKKGAKPIPAKSFGGKRGRPGKKKAVVVNNEEDEIEEDNDTVKEKEVEEGEEEEKKVEMVSEKAVEVEESKKNASLEKVEKGRKKSPPRAPSPSSSEEEDMLQGKASPYRDFSDAENIEKEEEEIEKEESSLESSLNEEVGELENPNNSLPDNESQDKEEANSIECSKPEEEHSIDNEQSEAYHEESSDDEGINDIPLTPPRAPAPPPVESSEDEMEPDTLDSSAPYSTPAPNTPYSTPAPNTPYSTPAPNTPYSTPAPNTPFSVPGPNTPFSVPPPTNLMQQHSVPSEEMATGVSSVTSIDMPSAGSVETQYAQGSVESHPNGSVEMHPRSSTEMHPHGSVEMHPLGSNEMHPHGSNEMPPHGSNEMHPHGSNEMHPLGSNEMHPLGSNEMHPLGSNELHPHGSVEMHPHGSNEMHPHGSNEMHPHGSNEMHPHGSVEMHPHGSNEMQPHGSNEMHSHGSNEMHPHGSNEMHPHGSNEMHSHGSNEMHPHGSNEMHPLGSNEMHPHGSVEMHPHGSNEMHPLGSNEMHPHGSVEMHPHGSNEMHPLGSNEMHPHGSNEMHPHGSNEMHPHGSVEMHPHGSNEMHPHGSAEMHPHGSNEMHPHGSNDMHPHGPAEMHPYGSSELHAHGSNEMHPHRSVEMHSQSSVELRSQGSVDMHHRPPTEIHPQAPMELPSHGPVDMRPGGPQEMHSHSNMELHAHTSTDIHAHGSLERSQSHAPADIQQVPQSLPPTEAALPGDLSSAPADIRTNAGLPTQDKYSMPPVMEDSEGSTAEADKRYFDQYLKNFSGGLIEGGPDARSMMSKSPTNSLQPVVPTSVITSLGASSSLYPGQTDLRRMEAMVGERHHHDSLYARDTLSRMPERQSTATPLLPTTHTTPTPTFDAFPSLNPLHSTVTPATARDGTPYLRQQENLFATPPVTSSFMAEAMFQRQSMTTPFLSPQPTDRNSLSRIADPAASLRTNNTSSFLRRPTTVPGSEMFAAPTVPQTVPRHPLTNAWSGQEVRPTHWQNPYLPRQPNMSTANNPFFPTKDNYLASRDFMFDPSAVRSPTERGMFSSLASSQPQDSLQLDRFDLSNFFPSAVSPYGTASSLDYTRTSHTAAPKPFDDRYRQTAAASAALPDFRGLPPTTGSTDMFSGIGVNSGFNLYSGNHPMPYHPQHMTDNMNSAFLTHPTTAQHAMLERDYAAAAAHRGLYSHHHQNSYPFIDDRQYSGSSKLSHTHTTPTTMPQERDLMSRSAAPESQMQDPYRSMLYRY